MTLHRLAIGIAIVCVVLPGCRWSTPSVDNPFPNLRVDVVRRDAPSFTVLVENHSGDRLQVTLVSIAGANGRAKEAQEERFVLPPQGDISFPLPADTRRVQVTDAHAIRQ